MRLTSYLGSLVAAFALLPAAGALAADYDPPIVIEDAAEYVPVELGSGWYLRGDVGYAFSTSAPGNFTYRTYDATTANYADNVFTTGRLRTDFGVGVGFGYRFTDWIRADATVDWFRARFNGTTTSGAPCVDPLVDPAYAGTTCRSEDSGRAKALSFMANGYVDLGTYVGLTPYVGAGVGMTYLQWEQFTGNNYCVGATCPAGLVSTSTHASVKDWRFTYAAMAGISYDVNKNIKIDLGYRFRRISGGSMFGWDTVSAAAGATGVQGRHPGLSTHEVKIGVRYELW
jgi:opacity protein-like surface antigen